VCLSVSAIGELVLIGLHVDPDTVVEELRALVDVHKAVARRWMTDNILMMGDFNADGRFISQKNLDSLELRTDTETFTWLIGDEVDTTVADNDYTYDRCAHYRLNHDIFYTVPQMTGLMVYKFSALQLSNYYFNPLTSTGHRLEGRDKGTAIKHPVPDRRASECPAVKNYK